MSYGLLFELVMLTIVVAMLAAFLLLLAHKLGIVEYMQVHGNRLVSEMAQCDFCMSWWLSVAISIGFFVFTGDSLCLTVPLLSTPLARHIKS